MFIRFTGRQAVTRKLNKNNKFNEELEDWNINAEFYREDRDSPYQKIFEEIIWRNYDINKKLKPSIEIGCSSGQFSRFLDKPVVVDISPKMLEIAKEYNGMPICCSADKMIFKNKEFQLIVVNNTFHHLKAQGILSKSIDEISRIARDDAYLCFTDRAPNLAGNGSVWFFNLIKKIIVKIFGRYVGCGSRNEPAFNKEDYELIKRYWDFQKIVYWRTLPTYILTVVTHVLSQIFGWKFSKNLQRRTTNIILFLENHLAWKFWCTEISINAKKRNKQ